MLIVAGYCLVEARRPRSAVRLSRCSTWHREASRGSDAHLWRSDARICAGIVPRERAMGVPARAPPRGRPMHATRSTEQFADFALTTLLR